MLLEDIVTIAVGLGVFVLLVLIMPPLLKYGPRVIVALFYRFIYVDFDALMSRLADMAGSGAAGTGSEAGSADSGIAVPLHRNQAEPDFDAESEPERESVVLRQLPRTELIVMLAIQNKDDGNYLFSANEIKQFVGGRAADVGEIIAGVRGKKQAEPPARSVQRPTNGWQH